MREVTRKQAELLLDKTFGLHKFYDKQWETIQTLSKGERVLLIEKTGFGKSLCFQFPAVAMLKGTTVVFSPLISLMRDQVKKLRGIGISAKCINSEQSKSENNNILKEARQGLIKILYIAPERQGNKDWIEVVHDINLSMVVIDEAHCISVWGHDFRPSYRRIVNLVNLLPKGFPVLALTATATKRVELDIANQIGGDIKILRGNLMRENFKLFVLKVASEEEKHIWLAKNINKFPGTGIIYTGTRVDSEIYSKWLEHCGVLCTSYNAGLDAASRVAIENGFMRNEWKCIISTNALGMGIDKPDIRFIIHTQFPQSPIHYYQEIGRAGRDGKTSYIVLLYNYSDKDLPEAFIEGGRPTEKKYRIVIDAIKESLLNEKELMKITNLSQQQIRVITADLIEQGIIREVMFGRSKKFEYIPFAKPLNTKAFDELRTAKMKELEDMIGYAETNSSRMKYLCDYLGDGSGYIYKNCDNTGEKKLKVRVTSEWKAKRNVFIENFFPELDVESKSTNLVNGVAASYYGFSNVGTSIHRSKYENGGDFPDFLLEMTLKAFRKKFGNEIFDIVIYIPPTTSGDLVKNFSEKFALALNIPVSHHLIKKRQTKEQKVFANYPLKSENVSGAFTYRKPEELKNKKVILIDDIYDSGATLKETGKLLTACGASKIAPVVIAKTVGGDKL